MNVFVHIESQLTGYLISLLHLPNNDKRLSNLNPSSVFLLNFEKEYIFKIHSCVANLNS